MEFFIPMDFKFLFQQSVYSDIYPLLPTYAIITEKDDDIKYEVKAEVVKNESVPMQENGLPNYIKHIIDPTFDNLQRLSMMYDVNIDAIKEANAILSRGTNLDFYDKPDIIIPLPKRLPKKQHKVKREDNNNELCIQLFAGVKNVPQIVAKMYLGVNDYNLRVAVQEYERDLKWDNEQKEKKLEEESTPCCSINVF